MKVKEPAFARHAAPTLESAGGAPPERPDESPSLAAGKGAYIASLGATWNIEELVDVPLRGMRGAWCNRERMEIINAARHQLALRRMTVARRAAHDPHCRWCQVRVPWKRGAVGDAAQSESGQPGERQ